MFEYRGQRPPKGPLEQEWWNRHGTTKMYEKWPRSFEDTPTLSTVLMLALATYCGLLWWFGVFVP